MTYLTGHVIARTEFSLSYVSPPPQICLCMEGRGLSGPRSMLRPGHHLYEGGLGTLQGAPLHSHTETTYAGTRALMRHRVRVALYNRLFARSIVALYSGVGDKIPHVGKG